MTESHKIPAIAKTAVSLLSQQYQASLNNLAKQTVESLGLDASKPYNVDFDRGVVVLEVPDKEGAA